MNARRLLFLAMAATTLPWAVHPPPGHASGLPESAPWGRVEREEIFLEAPTERVALVPLPASRTVWRFPGRRLEEVTSFFDDSVNRPELLRAMQSQIALQELPRETRAFPQAELLRALPPLNRRLIYRELARFDANPFHRQPVFLDSDDVAAWYARSSLPPGFLTRIETMIYPVGSSWAFSDFPSLLRQTETEAEETALRQAMTRARSFLLTLHIGARDDRSALLAYWSLGDFAELSRPLRETLAFEEGTETSVDLTHLLPPLPRRLLHTFPSARDGLEGEYPDAFWTSANFFEPEPDPSFRDREAAIAHITATRRRVEPPWLFGDVIFLRDPGPEGRPVHACVYLADDLVFTKNRRSPLVPWVVMDLDHVAARFSLLSAPVREGWRITPVP